MITGDSSSQEQNSDKLRLSAIQMLSEPNVAHNLAQIENQLKQLTQQYPNSAEHLVVLPECCLYFGGKDKDQLALAKANISGDISKKLAHLAKQYRVYLLAGTVPKKVREEEKFFASSMLFSPAGRCIGDYDKIHLFDVDVQDTQQRYRESTFTKPGNRTTCVNIGDIQIGLTVCYDLRFPELYRTLRGLGADVICVPAAFTKVTGEAHWQALLQARAIENQVYIVAAGQQGEHANGRETWGHSMIISPWGEVLSQLKQGIGYVSAVLESSLLFKVRADIPVANHNQFSVMLNNQRNSK
ncbi:carbon-nitrogen hydrolase family protein [Thalassotalea aquiviva]|uniref:carbon-nitrogen hydrolase family protein n=1 Tax=Thalassotalea aquiviva TaxID=3242415 RepID=UPI003529F85F